MSVDRIRHADDGRVADYHGVRDGALMESAGLFVAEGRHIVRRVIESARYRVRSVLLNDAALQDLGSALATLDADVPVLVADPKAFEAIAGYDVHRGCLALVHRPPTPPVDALLVDAAMLVVLEGVTNADNVGGVFRNAAAFGADAVLLSPTCCDPLYRKAIRTSMGATLELPYARAAADDWPGVLARIKAAGLTLIALTPREPAETLETFASRPRPGKIAMVVGTEGSGLTTDVEHAADYRVKIPITARVDSLNLATAAAIALYELRT